ncbi:MAG: hypothetical protein IJU99_06385 [Lachnospiraceae bacterium]|nr:hypothetical protein [Lachnospiraceae bacterium]MBR0152916.1 hypothetical protein [Lachnospiraceae bacterium]
MNKTEIYIGLNDRTTKEQRFDTATYVSLLKKVCRNYGVPFSFHRIEGGYLHENGEYTEENSLVLTFLGVERAVTDAIAEDLCVFFRQESVLITSGEVEAYYLRGKL